MPEPVVKHGRQYKWWAFAAIAVGTFTSVADNGSVNVALPSIAEQFRTDLPTTQWVVIGYALAISALLLPMGRMADLVGRKQVYVGGFVVFVIGAALAGSAPSILVLILSKILQGIGAAMTQGTSMAMIVSAFPGNERGKALGLQLGTVGVGGVAGPALGGLLVSALGWRWVFYIDVLLGLLAILSAVAVLDGRRPVRGESRGTFDWPGATLSTAALVTFLLAMTSGSRAGWVSVPIMLAVPSLVGLISVFIWWELRTPAPVLDVRLFNHRLFSMGAAASFISFLGTSSVRFLIPFYLQVVLGFSPSQVGLTIVPAALSMVVMGPLSGRLSDRYGWRRFNVGGMALSAAGLFCLATVTVNSSFWVAMAGMVLQTSGNAIFYAPNNSSILSTVEQSRYGAVSGFLNLVRNSANVTSVALVTAIVAATMASMGYPPSLAAVSGEGGTGILQAFTSGLRVAFLTTGSLALVGMAMSFLKGGRVKSAAPATSPRPNKA